MSDDLKKKNVPPTPEPEHWMGTPRCPVCLEDWDVNATERFMLCCCKNVCNSCNEKMDNLCPLCRVPIPTSNEEGLAMLRRNVKNDNPAAIGQLGETYARGQFGLAKSCKKAARLYQRAADLGDVMSMNQVAELYRDGDGVEVDQEKAFKYYRMAADRGMANAQFSLAGCFVEGCGVAKDDAEAARWCKLAADQGFTDAEHNLGVMYERGDGVARDAAEAVRWLERAAAKGDEDAEADLADLRAAGPS